jgi:multidrug resistance protein
MLTSLVPIIVLCPLASSMLAPASTNVAAEFGVEKQAIVGAQSGFLHLLGVGPLFLAPMSETFGRRTIFLTNLVLFTIMQIPTALAGNLPVLITLRTITGLFASVGVANGGGSISDMFEAKERASVLGFYLLGPLLGPSLGPFFGGLIVAHMDWRYIFWILFVVSTLMCLSSYFFLHETYAPIVLDGRKKKLQSKHPDTQYRVEGASDQPIYKKILSVRISIQIPLQLQPRCAHIATELQSCPQDTLHTTYRPHHVGKCFPYR